jgi:hypothetical protein
MPSGPIQSFEIPVSVATSAELALVPVPVEGAGIRVLTPPDTWFSAYANPGLPAADFVQGPFGFWLKGSALAAATAIAQTRFVSKGGSDATGDGSIFNPFLTVAAALASITDASSAKPYQVNVGPGVFSEAFLYKPFCFVAGAGQLATTISNPNAQQLDASFSAAGTQDTGLSSATVGANLSCDFSAVASPGAGRFFLIDCVVDANLTFTGNNSTNRAIIQNSPALKAGRTYTVTNIAAFASASSTQVTWIVNATSTISTFLFVDVITTALTINGTSGTNTAFVIASSFTALASPVFTGDRCSFTCRNGTQGLNVAGADTQFVIGGTIVAGATHLQAGGKISLVAQGGAAPFTWTFSGNPGNAFGNGSEVEIINNAPNAMTIAGLGAQPSVLDGGGTLARFVWNAGAWRTVQPHVATGLTTLVAGVSPFIAADLAGWSGVAGRSAAITVTLVTPGGTLGKPAVLSADVTPVARSAGGQFRITSLTDAGVTQVLDTSTYAFSVQQFT